jgi:hypothetical protein
MLLKPDGSSPEDVVERVGVFRRPGGLRSDQLDAERVCKPARDLALQSEQIADVVVEPIRPQMRVCRGINKLGADADLVTRSPDAPLKYIADTQLAADLLRINACFGT